MIFKYINTTADYLQWSEAMNLIRKLAKDGNYKISLLIAIGCFTGLRISDILALRWKQILDVTEFTITERQVSSEPYDLIRNCRNILRTVTNISSPLELRLQFLSARKVRFSRCSVST